MQETDTPMAFTYAGRFGPEALIDDNNKLVKSTTFHVYLPGTTTPATLYASRIKSQPLTGLPSTDTKGNAQFYADYREDGYDLNFGGPEPTRVYVDEPPGDTLNLDDIGQRVPGLVDNGDGTFTIPASYIPGGNGTGVNFLYGTAAPTGAVGVAGQFYLDYEAAVLYGPKGSSWPVGKSLKGPKGETGIGQPGSDGRTILYGAIAPTAIVGQAGDFYIEFTNDVPRWIWGPKSAGTGWGSSGYSLLGPPGTNGLDGVDGQSAYDLAIAGGFVGSQADFIASLKGEQGVQGQQGPPGTSNIVYRGTYNSATAYVVNDQIAYNGLLYIANANNTNTAPVVGGSATWAAATIAGPQGLQGIPGTNGAAGASFLVGTTAPASGLGNNGDSYFDKSAKNFYGPKASGAWPAATSLKGDAGTPGAAGSNGADGKSVIGGNGPPQQGTGVNGESYLDLTTGTLYGPKASGAWPGTGLSLKGSQGQQGESGSLSLGILLAGEMYVEQNSSYDATTGRLTSQTVRWHDGSAGLRTPTAFAPSDDNTIDAYTVTHTASGSTVTKSAPTRDSNGNVTVDPVVSIVYGPNSSAGVTVSQATVISSTGYLLYKNGAYPARPAGLINGDARYKGPVLPSDIQSLDDWIETDS